MYVKDLVIGDHYWTVADTQLVEVELIAHTGQDRRMNCTVKAVNPKVTYEEYCLSGVYLHKDPDAALQQALEQCNDKLQDLEEDIDDLTYKLRRIRETQYALLELIGTHSKKELEAT